jgi:hypothetical protein
MPAISLERAQAQLELYLAAEAAVLMKQSYEIQGRKLTLADLDAIQAGIKIWSARVDNAAEAASGRSRAITITSR